MLRAVCVPENQFPAYPAMDYAQHRSQLDAAVARVLASGKLVLDAEVALFEQEFASYLGADHVVGVGSGTDAIELLLRAHDIGAGHQVVVPSLAPSAVGAAVQRAGAEPLIADCEREWLTLCPRSLDAVLSSNTDRRVKAVIAVHLYGQCVDWVGLEAVAHKHGVWLFEDSSQAHGAMYQGRMAGALGRAAAFSFYPTKNLAAAGDAGAIATSDVALAERLRAMRQYGWQRRYVSENRGVNSRLDEIQAAILRVKLATLRERGMRRSELASRYDAALKGIVQVPVTRPGCIHAWHLYVIRSERREALLRLFEEMRIPVAVHYPAALHQQPAFADGAVLPLPETEMAVKLLLSLPLHPYLSEAAIDHVCDLIRSIA